MFRSAALALLIYSLCANPSEAAGRHDGKWGGTIRCEAFTRGQLAGMPPLEVTNEGVNGIAESNNLSIRVSGRFKDDGNGSVRMNISGQDGINGTADFDGKIEGGVAFDADGWFNLTGGRDKCKLSLRKSS